ncbi:MAG: carbon-nitrogen hydrolase family protein [Thermoplasmata archaeon]|nr:carbon-nitrogen hydrolase family protein [Thermoplasmata archaeon]
MKISLVNLNPKVGNKKRNIKRMIKFIEKEEDAQLHVFGELSLTGYMCRDELFNVAEGVDGESINEMIEVAKSMDTNIIFGMPIEYGKGMIYNAAILATPEGAGIYRKNFLANFGPFEEKIFFGEGNEQPVFKTKFGKIGMCICYDAFFPEISKALALQGAEIIVCISASPSTSRNYFERVFPARAIENTVFFAYSNIVGEEENLVYWGGSQLYSPKGELLTRAEYFKEDHVTYDIDLSSLKEARIARPTLRDTKPDIFLSLYNLAGRKSIFNEYVKKGLKMGEHAAMKMKMRIKEVELYGNEDVMFGIKLATGCSNIKLNESDTIKAIFRNDDEEIEVDENLG